MADRKKVEDSEIGNSVLKILKHLIAKEQLASLLIAVIALLVAMRGCMVADRAAQLAEYEMNSQLLLTLIGTVDNENDQIKIIPTDPSITLQKAIVYYPKDFDNKEWPIDPPDYFLYVTVAKFHLREIYETQFKVEPEHVLVIPDDGLPIVVSAHYIAKGRPYSERSLYWINYSVMIKDEKYHSPDIVLKGLLFQDHLNVSDDHDKLLDSLWNVVKERRSNIAK